MAFEFDGKKYQQASTHQQEWGERLIAEFAFRGNEHILDLGCGDGRLTARLAELVPDGLVVGIDASTNMIATAQERHHRPNLQYAVQDINVLEAADQFNVIFSNATLHWIKDHRRLLGAMFRALKPGGIIRFNFAGDGNCAYFFKVVKEAILDREYIQYFAAFEWPWYMPGVDEYTRLVAEYDFKEQRVWGENADRYFPSVEEMTKWIDQPSLVPFLKRIDDTDKKSFRDLVVERMTKATQQPDGTCFETFRRINVWAKK